MAAIVHRCACTHLDIHHREAPLTDDSRPCLASGCGCADADLHAPEIIPTWRAVSPTAQAKPDPVVIEPGTLDGPGLGRLCDCEDCWNLYEAEAGSEAA